MFTVVQVPSNNDMMMIMISSVAYLSLALVSDLASDAIFTVCVQDHSMKTNKSAYLRLALVSKLHIVAIIFTVCRTSTR